MVIAVFYFQGLCDAGDTIDPLERYAQRSYRKFTRRPPPRPLGFEVEHKNLPEIFKIVLGGDDSKLEEFLGRRGRWGRPQRIDYVTMYGETPLHLAAFRGYEKMVKINLY